MGKTKANYIVSIERESSNPNYGKPLSIWLGAEEIEEEAEKTAASIWGKKEEMTRPFDSPYIRVINRETEEVLWENGAKVVTRPTAGKPGDTPDKAALLKQIEAIMNQLNGV